RAVGVPLQKAQEAMQAKRFDEALEHIKKAQAVKKKSPYEEYQIDEFLGFVLVQQKKYGEAAEVYERMNNYGQMPPELVSERTKAVAQMYFQEKQYRKAAQWAQKWIDDNGHSEDMGVLLAQAYYLLEENENAAAAMTKVVDDLVRSGQVPKEN